MQRLADRLSGFAAALLDPARAVPAGLVGPDGEPSVKRFAVYRNNVVVSLIEALQASFPAVCRIVGEEFFQAMARAYVVSEPPASPILLDYGAGFADFISGFEPAASLPYLSDVARLERAWTEAYHAPDAAPLAAAALADISSDRAADACFTLHPSLRFVASRFPALTIWRMNIDDGVPGPVDLWSGAEDALVMRPAADVEVRSMPPGGAAFLTALAEGKTLTEATKSAMRADLHFDLAANLAALISAGAFVDYRLAEHAREGEFTTAGT
jgi:Putative DNA-binding domain